MIVSHYDVNLSRKKDYNKRPNKKRKKGKIEKKSINKEEEK